MRSVSTIKQPTNMRQPDLAALTARQLAAWPLARTNYEALHAVRTRRFTVDGCELRLQFNPARIRSTAARVDARSVGERPCFLCPDHLPAEQMRTPWGDGYLLLLNPYPIFPTHFTLPALAHTPQTLAGHTLDFIRTTRALEGFTVFYNGPPVRSLRPRPPALPSGQPGLPAFGTRGCRPPPPHDYPRRHPRQHALHPARLPAPPARAALGQRSVGRRAPATHHLPAAHPARRDRTALQPAGLVRYRQMDLVPLPRTEHRPRRFYAEGDDQLLLSPASVDLAGVFITPWEEDFLRITPHDLRDTLREVTPSPDEMERIIRLLEE